MEKLKWPDSEGKRVEIGKIHQMLEDQRKKAFPQFLWANYEEYLKANNSENLEIIRDPKTGIYKIIHQKDGEKIVIPTPEKTIKDYSIVSLQGTNLYFAAALLLQFHGAPCERQSRKIGGGRYDRL